MSKSPNDPQRRVYVLPAELVERIIAFQAAKGFGSEVEAVRRLLDDALKSRDTPKQLIARAIAKLQQVRLPSEVAREILTGHPLVTDISFSGEDIQIWVTGAGHFRLNADGSAHFDEDGGGSWEAITDLDATFKEISEQRKRAGLRSYQAN